MGQHSRTASTHNKQTQLTTLFTHALTLSTMGIKHYEEKIPTQLESNTCFSHLEADFGTLHQRVAAATYSGCFCAASLTICSARSGNPLSTLNLLPETLYSDTCMPQCAHGTDFPIHEATCFVRRTCEKHENLTISTCRQKFLLCNFFVIGDFLRFFRLLPLTTIGISRY